MISLVTFKTLVCVGFIGFFIVWAFLLKDLLSLLRTHWKKLKIWQKILVLIALALAIFWGLELLAKLNKYLPYFSG